MLHFFQVMSYRYVNYNITLLLKVNIPKCHQHYLCFHRILKPLKIYFTGGGVFFRASNKLGIFNSYFMYSTSYTTSILAAPDLPTFIVIGLFKAYLANYAIFGAILEENKQVYL